MEDVYRQIHLGRRQRQRGNDTVGSDSALGAPPVTDALNTLGSSTRDTAPTSTGSSHHQRKPTPCTTAHDRRARHAPMSLCRLKEQRDSYTGLTRICRSTRSASSIPVPTNA
jgi:hypothetical protein